MVESGVTSSSIEANSSGSNLCGDLLGDNPTLLGDNPGLPGDGSGLLGDNPTLHGDDPGLSGDLLGEDPCLHGDDPGRLGDEPCCRGDLDLELLEVCMYDGE